MKTEKWIGIIGLSVLVSFSAAGSPAVFAKGAWIDTAEYTAESEDSDALVRGAEKAMAKPIPKLTDKTQAAPTGDKRDYISLAIYWWPDPDNPDGPYVRHDGKINPEKSDASRYDAPQAAVFIYGVVFLMYFMVCWPISLLAGRLEKRWKE